jgi:hypothetical protein
MSPEELVALVTGIAIAISKDQTVDEINLLAVIFSQLGDTLATIATKREICENKENNKTNSNTDSNANGNPNGNPNRNPNSNTNNNTNSNTDNVTNG